MNLIEWMDAKLYPSEGDSWDNKRFRKLLESKIQSHFVILDYGAGRGAVEEMSLKGRARRIVGVDLDESVLHNPFLDEAKVLSLPEGVIPYPDQSFDLVMSNNVMEHLRQPEVVFRETYRVLKPSGLFLAKTPNKMHYVPVVARFTPHAFHVRFNQRRGRRECDTFPTFYRCNTARRVRKLAREAGFSNVDIATWEGRPEYLRMTAPLYALGWLYERLVNLSDMFSALRCVMVFTLQRPARSGGESALSTLC